MINRLITVILLIFLAGTLLPQALPHPLRKANIPEQLICEDFDDVVLFQGRSSAVNLTNNVLVLRIDFPDKPFNNQERFPAYHAHNETYFNKYMKHLKDFYLDASKERYNLNYYMAPKVYTMSQNLAWYGDDNFEGRRRVEMIAELIQIIGDDLQFINYESLIVFHSGAGQESDIYNSQSHNLWSTFMSLNTFRNVLDPDNLVYQGIETADGAFVNRVVLVPSEQYHPDFDEGRYYELLGVLATQYGRAMGLPSLFGNVSSFGSHAGTGNYCIMGTGTWNNDGKTPPMPSAWVRYYAGWEEPIIIDNNNEYINIIETFDRSSVLYKIPFSEKEYYLIENRQHNPIKDMLLNITTNEWSERVTHTFELLPDEEQDFAYTELRDGTGILRFPIVNLMKNNLRGSEWDFFLDYTIAGTSNYEDPSGLLIWHIDEYVIDANITNNTINANPARRGVALKEADGIQHMTSSAPHYYMRGGPYKSYRAGNNDYLGMREHPITKDYSIPDASSNYGGVSFEIYDVSQSDRTMRFSVRFEPFSQTTINYEFENYLEPFVFDFKGNGINTVHYFHSDGYISLFENNIPLHPIWLEADTLAFNYTFDGEKQLVIPAQDQFHNVLAKLLVFDGERWEQKWSLDDWFWANPVVYIDDEWTVNDKQARWILSLTDNTYSRWLILDQLFDVITDITINGKLSNFLYHNKEIRYVEYSYENAMASLVAIRYYDLSYSFDIDDINPEADWKIYQGDFFGNKWNIQILHYNHLATNRFFIFEDYYDSVGFGQSGGGITEININMPFKITGQPVFKDVSKNGKADIILSHANGFSVFTITGHLIKHVLIDNPDPLNSGGSGLIAWNWKNNDEIFYIGGFSRNRLMFFDSSFNVINRLTKSLSYPLQTLPFITSQNNDVTLFQATDKGRIYNIRLDDAINLDNLNWSMSFGNYYRNGYWEEEITNSFIQDSGVFVKEKTYVFPSPWIKRFHNHLTFNVMTTQNTTVEISIYTISGQLITKNTANFIGYEENRTNFVFNPERWASGVYFAVLNANGYSMNIKFGIEK